MIGDIIVPLLLLFIICIFVLSRAIKRIIWKIYKLNTIYMKYI